MTPEKENDPSDEINETEEIDIITLTDEDGKEQNYELLLSETIDGIGYVALIPINEEEDEESEDPTEYVLLRINKLEDGEEELVSIDDEEEFERIAAIFNDKLFSEYDYDDDEDEA